MNIKNLWNHHLATNLQWMVYNGKPYEQMDDLGVPLILGNIHINLMKPNDTGCSLFEKSAIPIPGQWMQLFPGPVSNTNRTPFMASQPTPP